MPLAGIQPLEQAAGGIGGHPRAEFFGLQAGAFQEQVEFDSGDGRNQQLAQFRRRVGASARVSQQVRGVCPFKQAPGADGKARKPWRRRIEAAIEFGQLPARRFNPFPYEPGDAVFILGCSTWLIDRDDYRTWRAAQSAPPEDSFIRFWLDELAPPPQGEPDRPEQGAAVKHETELQMHKRECQEIGKRLWAENPNSTKADILKHREMQFYVQAYRGKNTVTGWLAEIDPRPKDQRRGRPKKIPV